MSEKETPKKPAGIKTGKNLRAWKYVYVNNAGSSENLNKKAVSDGINTYTFGLMFRQWEKYASVFSALKMTEEEHARVGLLGSTAAEVTFAFYGLNMVGAQVSIVSALSSFSTEKITNTIRDEKLTDFIITDDFAQPNLIAELLKNKEKLGLRNVLLLHIPIGGAATESMLSAAQESKWMYLKNWFAPICMDVLLNTYANFPVHYTTDESRENAVIIHTSGTTSGTGKPIAMSDKALNAMADSLYRVSALDFMKTDLTCGVIVDLSNAYGIINQVHVPLAVGGAIAICPAGALNPFFFKTIPEQKITLLFAVGAMFEVWMKMPKPVKFDFSSLRCIVIGGSATSAKDKKRYYEFLRANGCGEIPFINGYGISELGGACCLAPDNLEDESIGYLMPGVEMRIFDEEKQKYYGYKDRPKTGVLYLHSDCATSGKLDGKDIVQIETIDRKAYVCTNDLVHVDETGKITYLGRANRYFLNDSGIKYESGRVETEISRQSGIESCCVVPVYVKLDHDNIPMLCVKTVPGSEDAKDVIRKALLQVFSVDQSLEPHNIPARVLIAKELPRNANGKIDLYKIGQGAVEGEIFTVETVKFMDRITDFKFAPFKQEGTDMIGNAVKGIIKDMADNLPFQKNNMEDMNMMNKNPFAGFNVMNQMGSQWMNMMNPMKFMNQQPKAQPQAPKMPNFFCGMPQNMTPNFQQLNQMNQQMLNYMQQMNQQMNAHVQQMAQQMMQQSMQQNQQMMQMMNQMFQQMQAAFAKAAPAAPAAAPAEEVAEEAEPVVEETV